MCYKKTTYMHRTPVNSLVVIFSGHRQLHDAFGGVDRQADPRRTFRKTNWRNDLCLARCALRTSAIFFPGIAPGFGCVAPNSWRRPPHTF